MGGAGLFWDFVPGPRLFWGCTSSCTSPAQYQCSDQHRGFPEKGEDSVLKPSFVPFQEGLPHLIGPYGQEAFL